MKPVVASGLKAFRDIMERSNAGFNCDTDEEYIPRILEVLNSPEIQKTFAKNITAYVKEKAGWSNIAEKHLDVYKSLVEFPYDNAQYVYIHEPE